MWIIYTSYIHYTYVHSHPTVAEYTLFSSAHGAVSMIDPEIGQKSHRKFRTINIKPSVFSDYNGMKLEITIKRKSWIMYRHVETKQHTLKLNNTFLKIQWVKEEIKKGTQIVLRKK